MLATKGAGLRRLKKGKLCFHHPFLSLSQTTNFILFKLKELGDDNFKTDDNGEKFSSGIKKKKHCMKGRN